VGCLCGLRSTRRGPQVLLYTPSRYDVTKTTGANGALRGSSSCLRIRSMPQHPCACTLFWISYTHLLLPSLHLHTLYKRSTSLCLVTTTAVRNALHSYVSYMVALGARKSSFPHSAHHQYKSSYDPMMIMTKFSLGTVSLGLAVKIRGITASWRAAWPHTRHVLWQCRIIV
jgi:hypothetical protein